MRALRGAYDADCDAAPSVVVARLRKSGVVVTEADVHRYFSGRAQREQHVPKRPRYRKSADEQARLQSLWMHSGGVCPPRDSAALLQVLGDCILTYADVQQWYGQRRARERKLLDSMTSVANPPVPELDRTTGPDVPSSVANIWVTDGSCQSFEFEAWRVWRYAWSDF